MVELAGGPPASDMPAASSGPAVEVADAGSPAPMASPQGSAESGQAAQPDAAAAPSAATPPAEKIEDPLEPVNRKLFQVDGAIGKVEQHLPVRRLASQSAPKPLRAGLVNVIANLQEPTTFANQVLQRKIARAAKTAVRFVINSTAGFLGLFEPAKKVGLARVKTDFGQTLATYGVGAGPYLYLPVVGPMTLRDVAGVAADGYLSPFAWLRLTITERRAMQAASFAVKPANADVRTAARQAVPAMAARDEYAAVRQMHYQVRAQNLASASEQPDSKALQVASREPR
jgi:phospholipid-binding lipoprotein MlaA